MHIRSLTILVQVLLLVGASADERIYFVKPSNFSSNCPNNEYIRFKLWLNMVNRVVACLCCLAPSIAAGSHSLDCG